MTKTIIAVGLLCVSTCSLASVNSTQPKCDIALAADAVESRIVNTVPTGEFNLHMGIDLQGIRCHVEKTPSKVKDEQSFTSLQEWAKAQGFIQESPITLGQNQL